MNKSKLFGVLRHVLTFGGGYLVAKDYLDGEQLNELVAGALALIGLAWSYFSPEKSN